MLIHEWWGLNDNVRALARRLAHEGYAVLAVDLYGGDFAQTPTKAKQLMDIALQHPDVLLDNLGQARAFLADTLGAPAVGSLGWCFGGHWSLRTALALGDDLDAAVVYYGKPVLGREPLAALSAPLLAHFGADDSSIPLADVDTFRLALKGLDKDADVLVYAGAAHAFANPSGQRYNPDAADLAWTRTTAFLAEHLQSTREKVDGEE